MWYLPTDIEAERGIIGEMSISCETLEDVRAIKNPVVIDMYTGEVFKAEAAKGRGITVNVPVAEYPFVLCDAGDIVME